jgi:hypothetical protein
MNPAEIHVLLYSFSQCSFHVETLADTMKSGLNAFHEKRPNDFILIHAANTRQEIDAYLSGLMQCR